MDRYMPRASYAECADVGAGTCPGARRAPALETAGLAGPNQVDEDVPLVLLEDRRVGVLPDPDLVAFEDDFRAVIAVRAERNRNLVHVASPPLASICGHTTAPRPSPARHVRRIRGSSRSIPSMSDAFCSSSSRTWTHGRDPERRSATICAISERVRPSRRARPTKARRSTVSDGYTRYPAGVRRGVGRMRRASLSRSAFRPTPLLAASFPTSSP